MERRPEVLQNDHLLSNPSEPPSSNEAFPGYFLSNNHTVTSVQHNTHLMYLLFTSTSNYFLWFNGVAEVGAGMYWNTHSRQSINQSTTYRRTVVWAARSVATDKHQPESTNWHEAYACVAVDKCHGLTASSSVSMCCAFSFYISIQSFSHSLSTHGGRGNLL
jgi:hypothetical protein